MEATAKKTSLTELRGKVGSLALTIDTSDYDAQSRRRFTPKASLASHLETTVAAKVCEREKPQSPPIKKKSTVPNSTMKVCGTSCCATCCVGAVLMQIVAVLCVVAVIPAAYLSYEFYLKPWGEAQLSKAAANGNVASDGLSCANCAGVNLEFPVSASRGRGSSNSPVFSSFEVYLINNGGQLVSAFASAGVAIGGISLIASLLAGIAASSSASTSTSSAVSSSSSNGSGSLLFGALLMVNQGQFITLLGSLSLQGAPRFFYEFCSKFTWTNLQVFFPRDDASAGSGPPRALLAVTSNTQDAAVKGVQRYAQLVGVRADHLFYYTCLAVACACALIATLYLTLRCCIRLYKKNHEPITSQLDNRMVWATILLLLVFQYTLAMTSCFQIHSSLTAHQTTGGLLLALCVLAGLCLGFVAFGVFKIAKHAHELEDLGTQAHEKKPFNHKYGVYYEDFTRANTYFFVAKIGLEILSGAVVGFVQSVMPQIALLVALNTAFLVLVIIREPYLVRVFYYVSVLAGFLRVALLLLTVIESSPDIFPQRTRNLVAEFIIGINALLFACLLVRQLYAMTVALYTWCQSSTKRTSTSSSSGSNSVSWGSSRSGNNSNGSKAKGRSGYEPRFTLQELIASKIRDEPSPVTPPKHDTPPASRQPYQDNPNHRFV